MKVRRQVAAARTGDDHLFRAVIEAQAVVAERRIPRNRADSTDDRAVLEGQLSFGDQRRAAWGHGDGRAGRLDVLARCEAHRRQHRRANLGRDRLPLAEGVHVGRLDQLSA